MATAEELAYVTYRLRNGTHILIHSSNKPVDADEPKLGQDLVHSPDIYIENNELLLIEESENKVDISWSTDGIEPIEPIADEIPEFCPEGCIDQLGDVVISFKCKYCNFLSVSRNDLVTHFEECHCPDSEDLAPNAEDVEDLVPGDLKEELNEFETLQEDQEGPGHEELMVYLCGECNEVLNDLDDCREHMKDHHNILMKTASDDGEDDEDLACEGEDSGTEKIGTAATKNQDFGCQIGTSDLSSVKLENLSTTVEAGSRSACPMAGCQLDFAGEAVLAAHVRCHGNSGSRAFRCSECGKPFGSKWRACVQHLWKKHAIDAGMLNCPVCKEYWTLGERKMANHLRTHGEARPYACEHPGCGKGFKQQSQLRNHRVLHLDRASAAVPRWYSSQKCEICEKTYADSKCLKKHVQSVHRRLRPYVCSVCGHASARKAMLQMHHRQHTGEKPYTCDQCSYRTGDHNSLRRHKMRHNGRRPYQCPHCSYASIQSNSYKNHLRNKHPGLHGAFECPECDFRTVSQDAHSCHVREHARPGADDAELFPENEMAASLICHSLGGGRWPGDARWRENVLEKTTSADGMTQTITIKLLAADGQDEDEEDEEEVAVDTGGITIPAEPDGGGGVA